MTTILFILFALFIVAGWITAEWNYRSEKEKSAKAKKHTLVSKQKSEKLESVVEQLNLQLAELNEAYEYTRRTSDRAREIENENKALKEDMDRYVSTIEWLDKKIKSREYTGNSLARVIKAHLEHTFPSTQMKEQKQVEDSKETFRRIKKNMG